MNNTKVPLTSLFPATSTSLPSGDSTVTFCEEMKRAWVHSYFETDLVVFQTAGRKSRGSGDGSHPTPNRGMNDRHGTGGEATYLLFFTSNERQFSFSPFSSSSWGLFMPHTIVRDWGLLVPMDCGRDATRSPPGLRPYSSGHRGLQSRPGVPSSFPH